MSAASDPGPRVWLPLVVCGLLIIGGMAWLTSGVVRSERERSLADSRAGLEERIRLSLWRMDGAASSLVLAEEGRVPGAGSESAGSPYVRLRFRVAADGSILPDGDAEGLSDLGELLVAEAGAANSFQLMCRAVSVEGAQWSANNYLAAENTRDAEGPRLSDSYQQGLSMKERAVRGKVMNNSMVGATQSVGAVPPDPAQAVPLTPGLFQPTWISGEAFLLRLTTGASGLSEVRGAWLRTDAFRGMLLGEIADLLPEADLEPVTEPGRSAGAMTLAAFPWKLVPGEVATAAPGLRGPVIRSLAAGWLAVLVALAAGWVLVLGIMRLSERRASFVSAVTHELRTPLTTFRLYSEMLESGAVEDEEKRGRYFRTLRREADRLSHLVENVLAFSRIERRSRKVKVTPLEVAPLVERMRERLGERLAASGLRLTVEKGGTLSVAGDEVAIEHILFNLVDNAAKYAACGEPPEVLLSFAGVGDMVELSLSDHGPGVAVGERREIFRAFHKSAQEAAESQPGVGLGLALSRRLARCMGGDLRFRPAEGGGACFVLSLPAA